MNPPDKPVISAQIQLLLKERYADFENVILQQNPDDALLFTNSTVEDVYSTAREVEREMEAKGLLRNLRRIIRFLDALTRLKNEMAEIEGISSFLTWTVTPIIQALRIASKDAWVMEKLIAAYDKVAQVLPQFESVSRGWNTDPDGHSILALLLVNIIDLHQEIYLFLDSKSRSVLLRARWSRFERRLRLILDNCAEDCNLLNKLETNKPTLSAVINTRRNALDEFIEKEEQRSTRELQTVLSWLRTEDDTQDEELDRLHSIKHKGSCVWLFRKKKIRSWYRSGGGEPIIWLTGKPGAGKSVLSATVVEVAKQQSHLRALYYFCGLRSSDTSTTASVFRSFVAQLVRTNPDCAPYIYLNHVQAGHSSSLAQIKGILQLLIPSVGAVRIILDGVDEIPSGEQEKLLKSILALGSSKDPDCNCKLLISSRDTVHIAMHMSHISRIDLNRERGARTVALESFIKDEIGILRRSFNDINADEELVEDIEKEMVDKADGMFLWLRLVLSSLRRASTLAELRNTVRSLPQGLEQTYERITHEMLESSPDDDKIQTLKIISWALFGVKPLRKTDILQGSSIDAATVNFGNEYQLRDSVLELCKPLIEERSDGTVRFIHFTVHEYFQTGKGSRFIHPAKANWAILSACLSYLVKGLDLVAPDYTPDQQCREVSQSIHGLCRYARENWVYHLKQCSAHLDGLEVEEIETLRGQTEKLYEKHHSLQTYDADAQHDQPRNSPRIQVEEINISFIKEYPVINAFIQDFVAFKAMLRTQQFSAGKDIDEYVHQYDPTLFGRMLEVYNTTMQRLCTSPMVGGIPPGQLARFKQQFGPSAFPCRSPGCVRAFSTDEMREDHEMAQHFGRIRCLDPSCPFSRIGFSSSRALQNHTLAYHSTPEEMPTTLRRRYQCQGCLQRFRLEREFQRHRDSCTATSRESVRRRTMTDTSPVGIIHPTTESYPITTPLDSPIVNRAISDSIAPEEEEPYTIKCICAFKDDDGNTVFCEGCETWQHIECYYHGRDVPEVHNCVDCEPRRLDGRRATERQKRLRQQSDTSQPAQSLDNVLAALAALTSTQRVPSQGLEEDVERPRSSRVGDQWNSPSSPAYHPTSPGYMPATPIPVFQPTDTSDSDIVTGSPFSSQTSGEERESESNGRGDVAPSTHTVESPTYRPQSPTYTPSSPFNNGDGPVYRLQSPIYTPQSPFNNVDSPVYIPESPKYTPYVPFDNPNGPIYYKPESPTYTPSTPVNNAEGPTWGPESPRHSPAIPGPFL